MPFAKYALSCGMSPKIWESSTQDSALQPAADYAAILSNGERRLGRTVSLFSVVICKSSSLNIQMPLYKIAPSRRKGSGKGSNGRGERSQSRNGNIPVNWRAEHYFV